ncbi:hypothetical protein PG997_003887 [Apiospora hydei]|uniref:Uncharacterized protein n=1 Tax=Apiospora hydei TaxID=1337664 RepID=A0ABR1X0H7_9PEZI
MHQSRGTLDLFWMLMTPTILLPSALRPFTAALATGVAAPLFIKIPVGSRSRSLPPPSSSQLTSSSLRHHTSLSRRPSRARRSAARNVQDAKTRGWAGRRKQKKAEKELDAASSAAWTDVTWASNAPKDGKAGKGSKCVRSCDTLNFYFCMHSWEAVAF